MKKLIGLLVLVLLLTGCSSGDPYKDDVYMRGNAYAWNGTAYQLVNTGLGGSASVPDPLLINQLGANDTRVQTGYFHELYVDNTTLHIGGVALSVNGSSALIVPVDLSVTGKLYVTTNTSIQTLDGSPVGSGAKGDKGDTGDNGTQGIQGLTGNNGTQGIQGIQGIQGLTGNNGTDGTNGTNGTNGTSGIIVVNSPIVNSGNSTSANLSMAYQPADNATTISALSGKMANTSAAIVAVLGYTPGSGTSNVTLPIMEVNVTNLTTDLAGKVSGSWAGNTTVTTLGTITTGTWNGTAIADGFISSATSWSNKQNALGFTPVNVTTTVNGQALSGNVTVTDVTLSTSNVTNNNATTLKHGFLPILSGSASDFLNGLGNWATVSASVAWGGIAGTLSNQTDLQNALNAKGTSNVTQADVDSRALKTTTVNGQALSSNVTITTITGNAGTATVATTANATVGLSVTAGKLLTVSENTTLNTVALTSGVKVLTYPAASGTLTTTTTAQKLIASSKLSAPAATSGTGETKLFNLQIPANSVAVGDTFMVTLYGNSSSTGTLIFRVRTGALGTTGDNQAWISTTSAAQVANAWAGITVFVTVRSATTVQASGIAHAGAVQLPQLIGAPATAAIVSTGAWYIDIDATCSVGTFTAQNAVITNE